VEEFKYDPLIEADLADLNPEDAIEAADSAMLAAAEFMEAGITPAEFGPLSDDEHVPLTTERQNLDLLLDVSLPIAVEVGRTQMSLDAILDLVPGSVITLDKKAEEPVDLRVNGKLVARGEVVLVDDVYGIRITQIIGGGMTPPGAN
jgi:flagellar motor switch protein FliN/FliY